MTASERIERYLNLFRLRLKMLTASRGIAAIAVAAAVITFVSVWFAIRSGFPSDLMLGARLALLVALVGLAVWFIVLPNRRIDSGAAELVEERTEEFAGRIQTYVEMDDDGNPLRELLAEDALAIADGNAPETAIPQREFSTILSVAGVCLLALLVIGIAGPPNYAYGVRHLWFGWMFPGATPPQSIQVSPGDDGIRIGGTVRVRATAQGFAPPEASVHARFGDGEWQQVSMADVDDGFEFTFYSVREPLEYYVSAASVRSPTYQIEVVDLPGIENLITTYRFPEWTEREPEINDPGGDIRTIATTEVEIEVQGDAPLTPGVLVVDDTEYPLSVDGTSASARFNVEQDGQYFVAAVVGGERIRLTDDYFITVLEDQAPEIRFTRPGRDWSASAIEEVTAAISVSDDFLVESLELRFSVNGGEWQTVELEAAGRETDAEHVFFLESLSTTEGADNNLVPGDLLSYYAVATDRDNTASTDIFFVDVQPFDRRYTQSQMSGQGMQGGAREDEISQRQREIIVSTWNLIREEQNKRRGDDDYVPNNAALLSRVQATLREQAQTLAERTRARMLTVSDEKIAEFVEHLDRAAEAMVPASERLAEISLEEAILPEQEALQHLLRAEAVFTDINVSMQANNRGGGGGQAGRDLSDMFELEMDLEKNQYETGSRATPDAPQQEMDELGNELEELARRQEQLANQMDREQQLTPAQRWQQDLLRREVEELQERLERMQQQAANQQQQQQSGQSGQSSQGSSSGEQQDSERQRQLDQLERRLGSAVRAMNEADQAMREGADREELQRAAAEAQRQLEGARDQAAAEGERMRRAALSDLSERANDIYDRQADIERRLQEAIRNVMVGSNESGRLDSGMTFAEEQEMANDKRDLRAELQQIEQDAKQTARELSDTSPEAADEIEQGLDVLRENEVEARLAISATYVEQGEAVYVSASESAITESLRAFSEALRRAETQSAGSGGREQREDGQPGLAETLAETQELRRQLQALNDAINQAGNNRSGPVTNRGRDDLQESTGVRVPDMEIERSIDADIDELSDDVLSLFSTLRDNGLPPQRIDELRRLASEVRASDFDGNEAILAREYQHALNLVEQIELALASAARGGDESVRAAADETVPEQHRKPVANYYRTLGEGDSTDQQ